MKFTFGIITNGENNNYISEIVKSIKLENIPEYEIIIVGNSSIKVNKNIEFNETIKPKWITKKKNLITENASYENIVYMHDYIKLLPGWYKGNIELGNNYDIRTNKILDYHNIRYRDWHLCPYTTSDIHYLFGNDCLLPYNINCSKYMYISGAYWIAKKHIMEEFPLDENLCWGQGEDVYWSQKVRVKYNFQMNQNSTVQLLKPNQIRAFNEIPQNKIHLLEKFKL